MEIYGRAAVSEFLGDNIIYRNLVPVDQSLPGLPDLWEQAGLPSSRVPRKTSAEYARLVAIMLMFIAERGNPKSPLKRVVLIGDTKLNDGIAFQNICRAGDWAGMAFIAAEEDKPAYFDVDERQLARVITANRWSALNRFEEFCTEQAFPVDEHTAVLLDLDKTTLGARGRNDQVIDQVRVDAANQTIRELLGDDFDEQVFTAAYQRLNQPEFHSFTGDNQDYLVYICMILGGGTSSLESLVAEVQSGAMVTFEQFLNFSEERKMAFPSNQRRVHDEVYGLVSAGDPTPFKEFRRQEYLLTVSRMGYLGNDAQVAELLEGEITITQEVRQAAIKWRERGAMLFGLSDKPDEASIPSAEMASQGFEPIHRVETHVLGA